MEIIETSKKLGQYHVDLRSKPKDSPGKNTLTLVETQQLPDFETVDSKDETSCFKRTIYNGRRKLYITFPTDTDKVNIVVYRYRNNAYLKNTEMEIKSTEYKKFLAKRVYLFSYIDVFYKQCIVLDETNVHN